MSGFVSIYFSIPHIRIHLIIRQRQHKHLLHIRDPLLDNLLLPTLRLLTLHNPLRRVIKNQTQPLPRLPPQSPQPARTSPNLIRIIGLDILIIRLATNTLAQRALMYAPRTKPLHALEHALLGHPGVVVVAGGAGEELKFVGEAGGFGVGGGGGWGGVLGGAGGGGGVLGGGAGGGCVAVVVGEDDGEVVVGGVGGVGVVEGGEYEVRWDEAARAVVQRGLDLGLLLCYARSVAAVAVAVDRAGWAV